MSIIIASDIHGSAYYARRLIEVIDREQPQQVILLGDIYNHGPRNPLPRDYAPLEVADMLNAIKDKLLVIKGNCDSEVDAMISHFHFVESAVVLSEGKPIYLTHGHVYHANHLPAIPAGSVLAYGHYHTVMDTVVSGVHILNPGSISLPKDDHHAYIRIEGGEVEIVELSGVIISHSTL
jgi:hypothetical protein